VFSISCSCSADASASSRNARLPCTSSSELRISRYSTPRISVFASAAATAAARTTLVFSIALRAVTLWKHKTTPSSLAPALPSLRAHAVTSASTIPDCAQQKERSTNGTSSLRRAVSMSVSSLTAWLSSMCESMPPNTAPSSGCPSTSALLSWLSFAMASVHAVTLPLRSTLKAAAPSPVADRPSSPCPPRSPRASRVRALRVWVTSCATKTAPAGAKEGRCCGRHFTTSRTPWPCFPRKAISALVDSTSCPAFSKTCCKAGLCATSLIARRDRPHASRSDHSVMLAMAAFQKEMLPSAAVPNAGTEDACMAARSSAATRSCSGLCCSSALLYATSDSGRQVDRTYSTSSPSRMPLCLSSFVHAVEVSLTVLANLAKDLRGSSVLLSADRCAALLGSPAQFSVCTVSGFSQKRQPPEKGTTSAPAAKLAKGSSSGKSCGSLSEQLHLSGPALCTPQAAIFRSTHSGGTSPSVCTSSPRTTPPPTLPATSLNIPS